MKIVIAEDEESVQQGMDEMLHMINPDYELIGTVTDEQRGMELIRKKQPDLVIIDVDLSGGRGLVFCMLNCRQKKRLSSSFLRAR